MELKLIDADNLYLMKPLLTALSEHNRNLCTYSDLPYANVPVETLLVFLGKNLDNGTGKIMGLFDNKKGSEEIAAGFAAIRYENGNGWLDDIFIYEEYRGRGYGRRLMQWALDSFKKENVQNVQIISLTGSAARPFSEKFGFRAKNEILTLSINAKKTDYGVKFIETKDEKQKIAQSILLKLPQWFDIPEETDKYTAGSLDLPFIAVFEEDKAVGFLTIKETSPFTAEIYVMGVLSECHRKGYGERLVFTCCRYCREKGYSLLQVKTISSTSSDLGFEGTRHFYSTMGFMPLEEIDAIWGDENPCLIMVKVL